VRPPAGPPPRSPRTAFAIVGFLAGIVTVVLVVLLLRRLVGG
jgi:hypothetical protein